MTRLLLILFLGLFIGACQQQDESPMATKNISYAIEEWETLGSQTLVVLNAENPTERSQEVTFTIQAINSKGEVFSKDTTVKLDVNEKDRSELLIDTEGEIENVTIESVSI